MTDFTEKVLEKIKNLLWLSIRVKGDLVEIIEARKAIQELLSDPSIQPQSLKEIHDIVIKSSAGFHLAIDLPRSIKWGYAYNFPNYDIYNKGRIKVYDLIVFTSQEPAIFCLQNPNFPDVLEMLEYNVKEWLFDREQLWDGNPRSVPGQPVQQRLQMAAIKAILGNPVLPLEIIAKLPDPFLNEDMGFTNTNYEDKEDYIQNSPMARTLLTCLSQEESEKLERLL